MTTLNAANEIAVEHFLKRQIKFTEIAKLITEVMTQVTSEPADELQVIIEADSRARSLTRQLVEQRV
jgi:1-deoxy-D-xylulose-5-phosphate reductoisomerase